MLRWSLMQHGSLQWFEIIGSEWQAGRSLCLFWRWWRRALCWALGLPCLLRTVLHHASQHSVDDFPPFHRLCTTTWHIMSYICHLTDLDRTVWLQRHFSWALARWKRLVQRAIVYRSNWTLETSAAALAIWSGRLNPCESQFCNMVKLYNVI